MITARPTLGAGGWTGGLATTRAPHRRQSQLIVVPAGRFDNIGGNRTGSPHSGQGTRTGPLVNVSSTAFLPSGLPRRKL